MMYTGVPESGRASASQVNTVMRTHRPRSSAVALAIRPAGAARAMGAGCAKLLRARAAALEPPPVIAETSPATATSASQPDRTA
jgi:hypothetical protein